MDGNVHLNNSTEATTDSQQSTNPQPSPQPKPQPSLCKQSLHHFFFSYHDKHILILFKTADTLRDIAKKTVPIVVEEVAKIADATKRAAETANEKAKNMMSGHSETDDIYCCCIQ